MVSTGMPAHPPQPLRALTKAVFAVLATSVPKAVAPLVRLLDEPPTERFTAYRATRRPYDVLQ